MNLRNYIEGIPERAAQRATLWHVAALPFKWAFTALFTFMLYTGADLVVTKFMNSDAFYCRKPFEVSMIALVVSLICAFLFGMAAANICLWLIPPARRALDAKASFRKVMTQLAKIILWVFPISFVLLLCLLSINVCYSDKSIVSRSFIFSTPQIYDISEIELVRTRCYYYRNKGDAFWKIDAFIRVKGGSELELDRSGFRGDANFERVLASLRHAPMDYFEVSPNCPQELRDKLIPKT